MANSSQAKKRIRQNKKKRLINKIILSVLRTYKKKFLMLVLEKKYDLACKGYRLLVSKIDKSVSKGVIHKNKAGRLKKCFNLRLKSIS